MASESLGRTVTLIGVAMVLGGCASSSVRYTPPAPTQVIPERVYVRPFDAVWESLVRMASGDRFAIDGIDKQSGVLSLSLSSPRPSEHVDCGITERGFTHVSGDRTVRYATADSARFAIADRVGQAFTVHRQAHLDARASVRVVAQGEATRVTVNTRYAITVLVAAARFDGRPLATEQMIFEPTTTRAFVGGEVTCVARGTLESLILDAPAR